MVWEATTAWAAPVSATVSLFIVATFGGALITLLLITTRHQHGAYCRARTPTRNPVHIVCPVPCHLPSIPLPEHHCLTFCHSFWLHLSKISYYRLYLASMHRHTRRPLIHWTRQMPVCLHACTYPRKGASSRSPRLYRSHSM